MFIQTLKMSPAKTSKMVPKIQGFSYLKNTSRHTHMHSHDAQNMCLWNAPQLQEAVVQRTVSEKYDEFLVFLCGQQSTIIHSPYKVGTCYQSVTGATFQLREPGTLFIDVWFQIIQEECLSLSVIQEFL